MFMKFYLIIQLIFLLIRNLITNRYLFRRHDMHSSCGYMDLYVEYPFISKGGNDRIRTIFMMIVTDHLALFFIPILPNFKNYLIGICNQLVPLRDCGGNFNRFINLALLRDL